MRNNLQLSVLNCRRTEHKYRKYEIDFDQRSEHECLCQNGIKKCFQQENMRTIFTDPSARLLEIPGLKKIYMPI